MNKNMTFYRKLPIPMEVKEEYPDAKIYCFDTYRMSGAFGLLTIYAHLLQEEGKSFDEVVEATLALCNRVRQFVTVHSLDALHRAGRVKGSAAFFGNLMGVKPILISDADGEQTPIKKVKGRMPSFLELVAQIKSVIQNPEEQTVYLAHADCSEAEIEFLKSAVMEAIPCRGVEVVYIGPIIGASIGPDAVGLWCFGDEVTYRVGDAK